jgi:TolB-like protein/DNA-binding winged helix-turn-helix (wHTH) protein
MTEPAEFFFDGWCLKRRSGELTRAGETQRLAQQPLKMLLELLEHPGEVVTRERLQAVLWPKGVVEFDNSLNAVVRKLRVVLGDDSDAPRYIETLPRIGYRFIGRLEAPATSAPAATPASPAPAPPAPSAADAASEVSVVAKRRVSRWIWASGAVVLAVVVYFAAFVRYVPTVPPGQSIAVLPFSPLLADQRNPALELGMANALVSRLSELPNLTVAPLSSVRDFDGGDALAFGRELEVASVLEGTLQRDGERLRVTARVLDVSNGVALWSAQFDASMADIFTLQDKIAEEAAKSLGARLTAGLQAKLEARPTKSVRAYELYLDGRFSRFRRDVNGMPAAILAFEQAIAIDPDYAQAWAGLGDAFASSVILHDITPVEGYERARRATLRAIELDPQSVEAITVMGSIAMHYDRDYAAAEEAYTRAMRLNDRYALLWHHFAALRGYQGRGEEAIEKVLRARELEPNNMLYSANYALFSFYMRDYKTAIAHARAILAAQPTQQSARTTLIRSLVMTGDATGALAEARRVPPGLMWTGDRALAFAAAGQRDEALRELADLEAHAAEGYGSAYDLTALYAALGDKPRACDALERSYDDHSQMIGWLKLDPRLDLIRGEPCYARVHRRLYGD